MSCQIFRDDNKQIIKVTAANGEDSRLYADLLNRPEVSGDPELAKDLWLTAYTPSFKSYFGNWEEGEATGLVDNNGEPFALSVINFINKSEQLLSNAPELTPKGMFSDAVPADSYFETTLTKLKEKFGIDFEMVSESDANWKGKFENGKVYINTAKALSKDTPFHEYLHPFISVLKKDNPALYKKLLNDLQSIEEGRAEIESTKQTYTTLTEEEQLDEALVSYLGKLATGNVDSEGNVTNQAEIRTRESLLTKFKNWLKSVLQNLFSVKLADLELTSSLQDIADIVSTLDVKIDMQGLPVTPYAQYQLDPKTQAFKDRLKESSNELQKKIIDEVYHEDPDRKIVLDEESHVYTHVGTGQVLKSTTTAIKGTLDDPENLYELNRLFGKKFDVTLQHIIEGKSFEEAQKDMPDILDPLTSKAAYEALQGFIIGLTADGSVVIPQVIFGDLISGIAGSLDLLVIKPNGEMMIIDLKVSKNSTRDPKYSNSKYPVNITDPDPEKRSSLSIETEDGTTLPVYLTTKQQHGIQVGTYKKLAEVNGLRIQSTMTAHIWLEIEGKGQDQKVKNFEWESVQMHYESENKEFVDQIVPTEPARDKTRKFKKELGQDNPANSDDFLDEDEDLPENDIPGTLYEKLYGVVNSYIEKLKLRKQYLEEGMRDSISFQPKKETIDRISHLLAAIDIDIKKDKPNLAYGSLLTYSKEQLTNIKKYLDNPDNITKPEYIDVVLEAEKFVESYRGLVSLPDLGLNSPYQRKMIMEVLSLLDNVYESINPALISYVKGVVRAKSSKNLSEEELDQMMKEGYDISLADFNLGDISTSKEGLLALADKIFKEQIQVAQDKTDTFKERMTAAGNKLSKFFSGKPDFSFMLSFNDAGEFVGRYVQKIGKQYWDLYYSLRKNLQDSTGENLQYIEIADPTTADPKDLAFNQDLWRKKQIWRSFTQAEKTSIAGYEDGDYHKYTDEFKTIRAQYQVFYEGKWYKKKGITDKAYQAYLLQHYDKVSYNKMIMDNGVPTGIVKPEVDYFPKRKYTEIRDISGKNEDMRDTKWVKLQNPTTELERAQSEFYKVFTEEMKATLELLPHDQQMQMLGKVARVENNFIENAKNRGGGFIKAIGKGLRDWFDLTPNVYSLQRMTDENGLLVDSIPVMYTGKLKNEGRVQFLKEQLRKLKDDYFNKKLIGVEVYQAEKERLETKLNFENANVAAADINQDMVENLIAFRQMAERYAAFSSIESTLLAVSKVVEKKKYYVTDSLGRKFMRKGAEGKYQEIEGKDSRAYKRFKKWFKMVYYNNDEYDASTTAQVMERMQNLTSLRGMGLNVFGAVNNYVMGRIYNAIEAWGGVYFDKDASLRATKEYNTQFLPGMFSGLGSKSGVYDTKKPNSKYEALVDKFRVITKFQADSGRIEALGWMYILQEGGEYNVQSKTGIAVLMSKKFALTNSITGEKLSVFDAYTFDPNTGELKLKDGFELSDQTRYDITNYIKEVNKQIHGNYAWEDRMVIQQHWLGKLAAQFHKWVYPSFKARFQERYEDENLGTVEGRYRSLYNLVKAIYQTEQNFFSATAKSLSLFIPGLNTAALNQTDELTRRNMYKNIAELTFLMSSLVMAMIISMLAEGVDDDDEELKKLLNFLQYQQSRQANEIMTMMPALGIMEQYQLVKSPIAVLGQAKQYAEAISSVAKLPLPPYDDIYFEKGPFKGDLKAWKELKDVIPVIGVLNRWESFETVKSFYIK